MPNKDWMREIPPLHLPEETALQQRIQKRVQEQLHTEQKQEEEMIMKKNVKSRIRPLILVAAIIGIGAVSLVTVNAATNGAVFTKISFFVNGEKQTFDGELVETKDDGTVVYEWKPEDYDSNAAYEIQYEETVLDDADGTYEIQCEESTAETTNENGNTVRSFRIYANSETESSSTEEN
ncbi:MAG: hypothetical protein MRZ94_04125 [Oscillospiraceae bacterium]|nr:hypothetical protein [Oscillospiraceae bacterium]MDD7293927.1 hypothetical protein [Oscillospiraceae bacterium]MDY2510415.1 hypothetical protein [Ruminococcus callidus]